MSENVMYKNCRMQILYFDGQKMDDILCEIRFNGDTIVVSYEGSDTNEVHVGKEKMGTGHYITRCKVTGGEAVFHRLPGSKFLNGYWKEKDGHEGMTRIQLGKRFISLVSKSLSNPGH